MAITYEFTPATAQTAGLKTQGATGFQNAIDNSGLPISEVTGAVIGARTLQFNFTAYCVPAQPMPSSPPQVAAPPVGSGTWRAAKASVSSWDIRYAGSSYAFGGAAVISEIRLAGANPEVQIIASLTDGRTPAYIRVEAVANVLFFGAAPTASARLLSQQVFAADDPVVAPGGGTGLINQLVHIVDTNVSIKRVEVVTFSAPTGPYHTNIQINRRSVMLPGGVNILTAPIAVDATTAALQPLAGSINPATATLTPNDIITAQVNVLNAGGAPNGLLMTIELE